MLIYFLVGTVSSALLSLPDCHLLGWVDWWSFAQGFCWIFISNILFFPSKFQVLCWNFVSVAYYLSTLIAFLSTVFLFSLCCFLGPGLNEYACFYPLFNTCSFAVCEQGRFSQSPWEYLAHVPLRLALFQLECFLIVLCVWEATTSLRSVQVENTSWHVQGHLCTSHPLASVMCLS